VRSTDARSTQLNAEQQPSLSCGTSTSRTSSAAPFVRILVCLAAPCVERNHSLRSQLWQSEPLFRGQNPCIRPAMIALSRSATGRWVKACDFAQPRSDAGCRAVPLLALARHRRIRTVTFRVGIRILPPARVTSSRIEHGRPQPLHALRSCPWHARFKGLRGNPPRSTSFTPRICAIWFAQWQASFFKMPTVLTNRPRWRACLRQAARRSCSPT